MKARVRTQLPSVSAGLARLRAACAPLAFEPHDIAQQLDRRGHYVVELTREFPFLIKLFHFTSSRHTRGLTWHERLELFVPLDGSARVRLGDQCVDLGPGDLLVVDKLKLHSVLDFPGFDTRVVVVSFLPEFVYSLGSPSHDYTFLLPFYSRSEAPPQVVRPTDATSTDLCLALSRLIECYHGEADRHCYQAGCKAYLLEALYHLARHCRHSPLLDWQFVRQQQRALRLKKLFDHLGQNYAEKITIQAAATLVNMSAPQFMKSFKRVAGMTLIAYVNHVRLAQSVRLLKETDLSIAEIASRAGFADQSYFDRRFKRSFGQAPKEFRAGLTRRRD